jgi:hypothetical protein
VPTSPVLALSALWSTKCSVVRADMNAGGGSFTSMETLLGRLWSKGPGQIDPADSGVKYLSTI